jgi:hypothetical protein
MAFPFDPHLTQLAKEMRLRVSGMGHTVMIKKAQEMFAICRLAAPGIILRRGICKKRSTRGGRNMGKWPRM